MVCLGVYPRFDCWLFLLDTMFVGERMKRFVGERMKRKLFVLLCYFCTFLGVACVIDSNAKADLLQCPYPAVNHLGQGGVGFGLNAGGPLGGGANGGGNLSVAIGGTGYYCIYPMEYNGSALWCKYYIVDVVIVRATDEACAYRCPNGVRAFQPNPPGEWKERIKKFKKCREIVPGEAPFTPPPEGITPVDMSPNPGEPGYDKSQEQDSNDPTTGVVTNPVSPNPLALDPQGR